MLDRLIGGGYNWAQMAARRIWQPRRGRQITRDKALGLLHGETPGVEKWNRRRYAGEAIPDLGFADLRGANLRRADLREADLSGANLREAILVGAVLSRADLSGADLSGANLFGVNFRQTLLRGTNLDGTILGSTTFAEIDLSEVKGLESVRHSRPSTLGTDSLILSRGKIPEAFLRGCGLPDAWIANLPALLGAMDPIQFYSCFISHSSDDKDFARRLHSRMRDEGLRVWFDEEDMKGGRELHPQIDEAIKLYDKLLLVLSEASMKSKWVATELRRARRAEERDGRRKLFPIRLAPFEAVAAWELPDSTGDDLAEVVRQFFIPDFTAWRDHDSFEAGFTRLLRDLKAEPQS